MKPIIHLFLDMEFTSLSPDGFVVGSLGSMKCHEIISETHPTIYNYLLRCPLTKQIFYVGKGIKRRCLIHEWHAKRGNDDCNPYKYKILKSILDKNLSPEILLVACGITEDEAYNNERLLVNHFHKDNLTNIIDGGNVSPMSNLESREKVRLFHIGRKRKSETGRKISEKRKGVPLSKLHASKISKSLKGNCYAGRRILVTSLDSSFNKIYDSMLKAEKEIPIKHETMSRKLTIGNGVAIIKEYKIQYYEN